MKKRGLSAVVTTLIIIMLVLVAVGVVWVVIANLIDEGAEEVSLGKFTINMEVKNIEVKPDKSVEVNVKRNPGEGELKGIKFLVSDGDNEIQIDKAVQIDELGQKTVSFSEEEVESLVYVKEVSIAPILQTSSGKENVGEIIDEFEAYYEPAVYEDSEDGNTDGWRVYDNAPSGATINNVYDSEKGGKVIEFFGWGTANGYWLGDESMNLWANTENRVISWDMKYSEDFYIYIETMTTAGHRYIYYTPIDQSNLGTGGYVHHGLGTDTYNGEWRTFVRNLDKDFEEAQPGQSILSVNAFLVRGSGRVDNIKLFY